MLIVEIRVCTNKMQRRALLDTQGQIVITLKSAPQDGKANKELIAYLAQSLKIPKAYIELHQGYASRVKRIAIDSAITREQLLQALGITSIQLSMSTLR